jgi:hypothetical protein
MLVVVTIRDGEEMNQFNQALHTKLNLECMQCIELVLCNLQMAVRLSCSNSMCTFEWKQVPAV